MTRTSNLISPVKNKTALSSINTPNTPQSIMDSAAQQWQIQQEQNYLNDLYNQERTSIKNANIASAITNTVGPILIRALNQFTTPEASPNEYYNLARQAVIGNSAEDPTVRMFKNIAGTDVRRAQEAITEDSYHPFYAGNNDSLLYQFNNMDLINKLSTTPGSNRTVWGNLSDNLMASAQGAMWGVPFGPWGALIGGIAGGLVNLGSKFSEGTRAKKLNQTIDEANYRKLNNFDAAVDRTRNQNNFNFLANYAANGGPININGSGYGSNFTNGVNQFNQGGSHEQNIHQGIPQGVDANGIPNLVEEGEVKWENYIFSKRIKPNKKLLKNSMWEKYNGKSFAKIAEKLSAESKERPNDPISKRGLTASMTKLAQMQETQKPKTKSNKFPEGGLLPLNTTKLRYAPVVGSALGWGLSMKPTDYSAARQIENAYSPISYTGDNTYMDYKPIDQTLPMTYLAGQSAANAAALKTASGGNRVALQNTLLANNYNTMQALSNLGIAAQDSNWRRRAEVQSFNRGTNQFNKQAQMQVDTQNANARMQTQMAGAQLRQGLMNTEDAAKSQALTNLFNNLGAVGKEEFIHNMLRSNPYFMYQYSDDGSIQFNSKQSKQ